MSRNVLHRHYDKLGADERFRLDVLAMARGDKREAERLVSSCSRFTLTQNDPAFTGRWLGVLDMTLRLYLELAGHLDRMKTLASMRQMLPLQDGNARDRMRDAFVGGHRAGARRAWKAAKGEGPGSRMAAGGDIRGQVDRLAELGSSILPEILDGLERKGAGHALTLWRGFGAFCNGTLGMGALKVLRVGQEAGAFRVDVLEALAERLEMEPEAESVEEICEGLTEAWHLVEGQGV
jgi:hypothetical protein